MNNIRIGTTIWCIPDQYESKCKTAYEMGLNAIELDVTNDFATNPLLDEKYCYLLLDEGLKYDITFPTLGLNGMSQFPHSFKENFENALSVCDYALIMANNMGIKLLQVPNFGKCLIRNEEEFQTNVEFFKLLCDKVADSGIIVGTENALSCEQNLRLINEVGKDNFKIYYDTQNHYVVNGYDQAEIADKLFDYIVEVHAKDGTGKMSNRLLGQGESNYIKTANVLKEKGYNGNVLLENNYKEISKYKTFESICELVYQDIQMVNLMK